MLPIARMVQRTRAIPGNNMSRYSLLTPALHLHVNHRQTKQYKKKQKGISKTFYTQCLC